MLSRSAWQKLITTSLAALAIVALYQVTIFDSRYAARQAVLRESTALPAPGARLQFSATAYCQGAMTASGVWPRTGVAAADPVLLPVGSVVQVLAEAPYSGVYTIMDTGPMIQGRHIDIYMWSCTEALRFGRRQVEVTIIRLGWNPRDSSTDLLPSHPLPLSELERLR
jgi:3D (Asp-Asp-Asp) domain-containing protein